MKPPIFFLCFANNENHPQLLLEEESENLNRLLSPFADRQEIQIHLEPFVTVNRIVHYLTKSRDRIQVFHYAGHANSHQFVFRDHTVNAAGIAHQLSYQKNLKLVFLNGCSTKRQVKLLLDLGIPAVIATDSNIEDELAKDFSSQFYSAIIAGYTIKEAFESAAALVLARTNELPRIYRAAELRETKGEYSSESNWGLYTISDNHINQRLIPNSNTTQDKIMVRKNNLIDSELVAKGSIRIGDRHYPNVNETNGEKNIVEKSKLKARGNIKIGDG